MYKHIIELSDGTQITSGVTSTYAIKSVSLQERVNAGTELTLGSTCSSQIQIELFAPDNALRLIPGEEIEVYEVAESATLIGTFVLERPERSSASVLTLTAYDRVTKLDKDVTTWLRGLTAWPYKLFDFINLLCAECGLEFVNQEVPNGDYLIQRFWAENITGRVLMEWAGQVAGRFCRATPEGQIEFAWYTPAAVSVGISPVYQATASYQNGHLTLQTQEITDSTIEGASTLEVSEDLLQQYYFQNGISFEEYTVAPIERVQIQLTEDDVGVAYPDVTGNVNTYRITGNYLLTTDSAQALQPVAQNLYEMLKNVSYTPCTIELPADRYIRAGNTISVTDKTGFTFTAYVMARNKKGQKASLESTGSHRRDSTSTVAAHNQVKIMQGRVARLRISLEEVSTELSRTTEELDLVKIAQSSIAQTVEGINTRVSETEQSIDGLQSKYTELSQTATGLSISINQLRGEIDDKADQSEVDEIAEHFLFAEDGLTITNTGTGMGIGISEQRVVFTGGESPTTVIRPSDMETTNLRVGVRLDLGGFSFIPRTNKNLSLRWTGD